MITREYIIKNDRRLVKTYSDAGYYIKKEGSDFLYSAAIDVPTNRFKYIETDILIPGKEENKVEETIKEE